MGFDGTEWDIEGLGDFRLGESLIDGHFQNEALFRPKFVEFGSHLFKFIGCSGAIG